MATLQQENGGGQPSQATGISSARAYLNLLNALSGIGVLSTPYALSEGGWVCLMLLFVMASVSCYTMFLLKRCMDTNPRIHSYSDFGKFAFCRRGWMTTSVVLYLGCYLLATEFMILEGDNLAKLFPGFEISKPMLEGRKAFVIVSAIAIFPTVWLRGLGPLAYIAVAGDLTPILLLSAILWLAFFDGIVFHQGRKFANLKGMPTAASIYATCFSAHATFPLVYSTMKDRKKSSSMLVISFATVAVICGAMALSGYLMFGDQVKAQITLNLPPKNISSAIAIYASIATPFAKYALVVTPIVIAIEEATPLCKHRPMSLLIRTLLVGRSGAYLRDFGDGTLYCCFRNLHFHEEDCSKLMKVKIIEAHGEKF
ncbi:vacuolar amino acid transporter 1-like isoform X3 [Amborella trichopoda]|uniref:vacuolar amino acid transporter 1-like isoform X3 n=1 Tax=Amborella trichopoda TaxID=13333 RepID=UPI0009BE6566|nr:vacuolar amino acid transporter 1-like isoform X3 [Amborella trichopoda]|eukprot:XP_020519734.1 vacuolar amino acid transporter 1-like isoform X3 [Amborella trichopoda]